MLLGKTGDRQRGAQLVELAFVLPILTFLVFAILEGGEFTRTHTVLNNAAREGARLIALHENQCGTCGATSSSKLYANCDDPGSDNFSGVRNAMCTYLKNENTSRIATAQVTATIRQESISNGNGANMTVSVVQLSSPYSYKYLPHFSAMSITLRTQAQFRQF